MPAIESPRRVSRLYPTAVDIARAEKVKTGGTVGEKFNVIVLKEPADIQSRAASYFQHETGRVTARRLVGFFNAAADVIVGDRIVTTAEIYLVTAVAKKGRHLEADLDRLNS